MKTIGHFVLSHWLFLTLVIVVGCAVWFIWKHKDRLLYNKPEA